MTSKSSMNISSLYRQMLRLQRILPEYRRDPTLAQIKQGFRINKLETDESKIETMIQKALSSIAYMKMITPRTRNKSRHESGYVKIVIENHESVSKSQLFKPHSNWTGSNMDPDSVKRHYRGLQRAGFKDNAHAIGPWGF